MKLRSQPLHKAWIKQMTAVRLQKGREKGSCSSPALGSDSNGGILMLGTELYLLNASSRRHVRLKRDFMTIMSQFLTLSTIEQTRCLLLFFDILFPSWIYFGLCIIPHEALFSTSLLLSEWPHKEKHLSKSYESIPQHLNLFFAAAKI